MAPARRKSYDDPFGYSEDPGYTTNFDPYEAGGVTGGSGGQQPVPPTPDPAQPPPPPAAAAPSPLGKVMGVDPAKYGDPNKRDFKYDVMHTLDNFDPRKGFTGDVLSALNGLGYGDFSSSGKDSLSLHNAKNAKDAADFNDQDWIYAFDANNDATKWNFGGGGVADAEAAKQLGQGNAATLGYQTQGGPGGGGGGSSSYSSGPGFNADTLKNALAGLFPNGAFNQDLVNRNVDNVRGAAEKARKSRLATNQALLADRGLIGSGPESRAYQNMDEDLFNTEMGGINDAYANESNNASARMMQALQIGAGMTAEEARNAVDWFSAQSQDRLGQGRLALDRYQGDQATGLGYYNAGNNFTLGSGRLALDNSTASNNYNLAVGQYGLQRDQLQYQLQNADIDRLISIINQLHNGANTSAGGYR